MSGELSLMSNRCQQSEQVTYIEVVLPKHRLETCLQSIQNICYISQPYIYTSSLWLQQEQPKPLYEVVNPLT